MSGVWWAQISEFVGSMAGKESLPEGLRLKSPYAALNNFDVGPLCLQLFALPKAILSLNIKYKQRQTGSRVHGKGWVFFALAYAANRLITAFLYHRTHRMGIEESLLARKMSTNFTLLAIVFAISAFLPAPYSYWLFGAGIVTIQLLYMLPKIGALECPRFLPRLGHMSERFALLLLIVVGEGFFKLVVTLAEKGIYKVSPDVFINFVFGGISVFVLCWIYFDFVGNAKPKDENKWTRELV